MKLIYLKLALKFDSFDVTIGTKIPFFRVLVIIEPGRSLINFVTTNCLIVLNDQKLIIEKRKIAVPNPNIMDTYFINCVTFALGLFLRGL